MRGLKCGTHAKCATYMSHPARDVWIKGTMLHVTYGSKIIASRRDAGIKGITAESLLSLSRSHLTGMRGLKGRVWGYSKPVQYVASHRGCVD